jgi:NAD(P)-dependent dehydrogenase (short-subunit alcohol dehydrogenase family)
MIIEQKVAVITRASQGIGAALVRGYRDKSYCVVAAPRSKKSGNDALRGASDDQPARLKAGQRKLRPHAAGVTNVSSNQQDEWQ